MATEMRRIVVAVFAALFAIGVDHSGSCCTPTPKRVRPGHSSNTIRSAPVAPR